MGKYSKYNFLFQNGNKGVLFNLATSRVMVLDEKIVEIIKQHKENIDFIKDISSPLYEEMEKNGMIVNDECNEAEDIIAKWDEGDKSQSGYHLTILPTLSNVQKITSAENLRSRASDEIVPFREFIIKDDTSALL